MNSTKNWSAVDTALFAMRMTATFTFAANARVEHHALHHTKAQAQGKRGKECGGATAGTEVPRVQLHGWSGHQAQRRNLWNGSSSESGRSREGPRVSASRRQWKNWSHICGAGAAISASARHPRC